MFENDDNMPVDPFGMPEPLSVGNEVMAGMPLPTDIGPDGKTAEQSEVKGIYSPDLLNKIYNSNGGNVTESESDNGEQGENVLNEVSQMLDGETESEETIAESLEQFHALNGIYKEIVRGGISKDLVYQVESCEPNLLLPKIKLSRISSTPSQSGYQVSVEAIGARLKEIIKNIIDAIVKRYQRIKKYLQERFFGGDKTKRGSDAEDDKFYKEVIDLVKARASEKGTKVFFAELSAKNDPNAMKASDAKDYVQLTIKSYFKNIYGSQINTLQELALKDPTKVSDAIYHFITECCVFGKDASDYIGKCASTPLDEWTEITTKDLDIAKGSFGIEYKSFHELANGLRQKQDKLQNGKGKMPDLNVDNLMKFEFPFTQEKFLTKLKQMVDLSGSCNENLEKVKNVSSKEDLENKPEHFEEVVKKVNELSMIANLQIGYILIHKMTLKQMTDVRYQSLKKIHTKFKH